MDRESARREIKSQWRWLCENMFGTARRKANGEQSYVCPLCGHGANGDGLTKNPRSEDGTGLKCFGCGFSGDIIDLYQTANKLDHNRALYDLTSILGIRLDQSQPDGSGAIMYEFGDDMGFSSTGKEEKGQDTAENGAELPQNRRNAAEGTNIQPEAQKPTQSQADVTRAKRESGDGADRQKELDFTEYYRECWKRISDPAAAAYLKSRGISQDTAKAYGIGYDPQADPAGSGHKCPRLIIPTSKSHYIGRRTDGGESFKKMNPVRSSPALFNGKALYAAEGELFITEGAFDALSIIEAGSPAIALNSAANTKLLLDKLEGRKPAATIILCMDGDRPGQGAQQTLIDGFKRLNISYTVGDILDGHKDVSEALTADREGFFKAVADARQRARTPDSVALYFNSQMSAEIMSFRHDVKTGFDNLDTVTGGLYPGLYIVAAITSLGKTTFCHQMAEQIAAAGTDVLFFSLEQSRLEMASKSLARRASAKDPKSEITSLAIRRGHLPDAVLDAERDFVAAIGNRLSVIEGDFDSDVKQVSDYIRRYISQNAGRLTDQDGKERRPVVFIDYLQLLQPTEDAIKQRRQSTKDIMDDAVRALKKLSRELNLTIFAISSVNRANYLAPISFESLKESGGIEYTADVVFGLQYACVSTEAEFNAPTATNLKRRREIMDEAKAATPREIELKCLKNRYGRATFKCRYDYFPRVDLFREHKETELAFPSGEEWIQKARPAKKKGR